MPRTPLPRPFAMHCGAASRARCCGRRGARDRIPQEPAGEPVALFTHLVVREDAHILYAFGTDGERRLFRALLKVSGVGPKIALGILSGASVDDFLRTIEAEDVAMLTRIPGIGRKTAERVIIEMRDSVKKLSMPIPGMGPAGVGAAVTPQSEAFSAL